MGYGARALEALNAFYNGDYFNIDEAPPPEMEAEALNSFAKASKIDKACILASIPN
jgi:N-acetyltransferase 10